MKSKKVLFLLGCTTMGHPKKQTKNELRKAQSRSSLLLRQKHHS